MECIIAMLNKFVVLPGEEKNLDHRLLILLFLNVITEKSPPVSSFKLVIPPSPPPYSPHRRLPYGLPSLRGDRERKSCTPCGETDML